MKTSEMGALDGLHLLYQKDKNYIFPISEKSGFMYNTAGLGKVLARPYFSARRCARQTCWGLTSYNNPEVLSNPILYRRFE
jgi:hypothetical protein